MPPHSIVAKSGLDETPLVRIYSPNCITLERNFPLMRIDVTQQDIDQGVPCDSWHCPITLAAQRAGLRNVEVNGMSLFGNGHMAWLPEEALDFIYLFDKHRKLTKPFFFEIFI